MNSMYTLSIILNIHRGGELVKKAILNLKEIIAHSHDSSPTWNNIELIAVLDHSDTATSAIVSQFANDFAKVERVEYQDLAQARNHGVRLASGNFILFADEDDYFSIKSLVAIYSTCYKHYNNLVDTNTHELNPLQALQHIAVFPRTCVEFPNICVQTYVDSNDMMKYNMMFHQLYLSRICCPRVLLMQNPLRKDIPPYGFEDWDLNNRLLALGVNFKVADDFVLFYRVGKSDSLLSQQQNDNRIVRYSEIYKLSFRRRPESISGSRSKSGMTLLGVKTIAQFIKKYIIFKWLNTFAYILPHYKQYLKFLREHQETDLRISGFCWRKMSWFRNNLSNEVQCFFQLVNDLQDSDTVILTSNNLPAWIPDRVRDDDTGVRDDDEQELSCEVDAPILNIGHGSDLWLTLSVANRLHVILKACIASKIKTISYSSDSIIITQFLKDYAAVLNEYAIHVVEKA